jgi:hypothetical protein
VARPVKAWSPFPLPKRAYPGAGRGRGYMTPQRLASAPPELYRTTSASLPISGAQALGTTGSAGTATLSVGPAGMGTVWYPAAAITFTSAGITSTGLCQVYIGPAGYPTTLQGTILTGTGTLALALPSISPGLYIIAVFSGYQSGTEVSLNVTGIMTVLTRTQ